MPAVNMKKKACSVCYTNCLRLHGSEDEDEDDGSPICSLQKVKEDETSTIQHPSFLKKITESTMTSTMQLPFSFVKAHVKRLSSTVILEGPSMEKWRVEVYGSFQKFSLSLRQGWRKFMSDHVLQLGDQLSFTLTSDSHFHVEVYDESGCQKSSALDATNSPTTPLEAKGAEFQSLERLKSSPATKLTGKNKKKGRSGPGRPKTLESNPKLRLPEGKETSDLGSHELFLSSPALRLSGRKKKERSEFGSRDQVRSSPVLRLSGRKQKERSEPDNIAPSAKKLLIDIQSSGSESRSLGVPGDNFDVVNTARSKISDLPETGPGGLLPPLEVVHGCVLSRRPPVTDAERLQTLQAAQALKLTNPNTLMVMTRAFVYRGFWLGLSRPFAKDWMPSEPREVTLVNVAGNKWPVKWLSGGLSGGWRRFSLDHRLEEYDICVFEIVDQENFELLVHIFRVLGGPKEDMGVYCPSPAQTSKSQGKNSKKTQKSIKVGDAKGTPTNCPSPAQAPKKSGRKRKQTRKSIKNSVAKSFLKKESNPNAAPPGTELVAEDPIWPSAEASGHALQFMVTATSPRKSNQGSLKGDLLKLAKELLTQNSPTNSSPLASPVQDGGIAHLQMIPHTASSDQVCEETPDTAGTSMPVRHHASPHAASEIKKKDERKLYKVLRMHKGRTLKPNQTEFLVELEGVSDGGTITNPMRDVTTGFWWVPSDHFDWTMENCYVD